MHAPGCCDSQTVPPIQLDPAAFVASSDAMACMACSSYTSTGTFVMSYSTQRAHAVGVYIRSRRRPKHKDDLHFAPIKNTRTPAKPRIQYVQNPTSFCCRSLEGIKVVLVKRNETERNGTKRNFRYADFCVGNLSTFATRVSAY